jgi:hypothetical protein
MLVPECWWLALRVLVREGMRVHGGGEIDNVRDEMCGLCARACSLSLPPPSLARSLSF